MDDFNRYDAPRSKLAYDSQGYQAEEGRGVWRDDDVLVMVKIARLPSRCIKCDEPTTGRLERKLSWHPSIVYLLVLAGLLVYFIVALVVRKQAKIQVPLCDRHRATRVRAIWTAWLLIFAGIGLIVLAASMQPQSGPLVMVAAVTILGGAFYGALRSQVVTPSKIDETHVWLKGVCPDYLKQLPRLPGPHDLPEKLVFPEL